MQVYNFTVDNAHTYFAKGYLAHNKGDQNFDPVCPQPVNCPNPPGNRLQHRDNLLVDTKNQL